MGSAVVAVIDIGKTNWKILLATPDGETVDMVMRANAPPLVVPYLAIDIDSIETWVQETLAEFATRHRIAALIATSHGCGAVLCDTTGPVLPLMDYEAHLPAKLEGLYARQGPAYAEVCSGQNLGAMSLAKQLLYQSLYFPEQFAWARRYLTIAQYLAWRWGGRPASEISQLAAQSHLWNYAAREPSGFLKSRGWDRLLPPFARAGEVVGTISRSMERHTGLSPSTEVLCGVHDSNANLFRYKAAGMADHAVLSTGTWMIGFNRSDEPALDPTRAMVGNIDVDGEPIASTLTMTGREYSIIDARSGATDDEALQVVGALLERGILATPSFVDHDGCAPGSAQRGAVHGAPPKSPAERRALASLYAALTADECLNALQARAPVVIDGGFADNLGFARLLAGLRPNQPIFASRSRDGTALGAALLWQRAQRSEPVRTVEVSAIKPFHHPGLAAAAKRWPTLWPRALSARAAQAIVAP